MDLDAAREVALQQQQKTVPAVAPKQQQTVSAAASKQEKSDPTVILVQQQQPSVKPSIPDESKWKTLKKFGYPIAILFLMALIAILSVIYANVIIEEEAD